MRLTLIFSLAVCLTAGCSSFSPPKPKQCEGEFRPVNDPAVTTSAATGQHVALCKGVGHVHG